MEGTGKEGNTEVVMEMEAPIIAQMEVGIRALGWEDGIPVYKHNQAHAAYRTYSTKRHTSSRLTKYTLEKWNSILRSLRFSRSWRINDA